jgi:hypothetical protein
VTYLRCTSGRWTIDLHSEEGRQAFRLIDTEGVRLFRSQPGFICYRLMVADPTTTIAVAEWESEEMGKPGAQRYREWLRSSGIAEKLSLETYDGRERTPPRKIRERLCGRKHTSLNCGCVNPRSSVLLRLENDPHNVCRNAWQTVVL